MIPSWMAVEYAERHGLDTAEVECAIQRLPRSLTGEQAGKALETMAELAAERSCSFVEATRVVCHAIRTGQPLR